LDISEIVYHIIQAHAWRLNGQKQETKADWSIFYADSLIGLIVATALVLPTKKLADVKLKSVMKRFLKEEPKFAAGTRRDDVKMCENSEGLNLPDLDAENCFKYWVVTRLLQIAKNTQVFIVVAVRIQPGRLTGIIPSLKWRRSIRPCIHGP
jgi:hypothetical protein